MPAHHTPDGEATVGGEAVRPQAKGPRGGHEGESILGPSPTFWLFLAILAGSLEGYQNMRP